MPTCFAQTDFARLSDSELCQKVMDLIPGATELEVAALADPRVSDGELKPIEAKLRELAHRDGGAGDPAIEVINASIARRDTRLSDPRYLDLPGVQAWKGADNK